jgi:carbamoyltransferase
MNILGFNIGVRGSAACLVRDGIPVTAAREEWFSRVPFDAATPERAIRYCLEVAELEPGDVDAVVRAGRTEGRLASLSSWLGSLAEPGREGTSRFGLPRRGPLASANVIADAQAALSSAFYPSDLDTAAILVLNGPGQGLGSATGVGEGTRVRVLHETPSPHGPGALYAALASRLGRRYPRDEAELMDLAGLGRPRRIEMLRRDWVELLDDGTCRFRLDEKAAEFAGAAGEERRASFTEADMDLARSVQAVFEEALLHAARRLRAATGLRSLAFAGDAALNPAAVGRLLREGIFDRVWIPPAPCDGALGAALGAWYRASGQDRAAGAHAGYTGPAFTVPSIESYLTEMKIASHRFSAEDLVVRVAVLLGEGRSVGWFQGRMWAGPQGLAARAVLADPRAGDTRDFLNTRVKRRGAFRTFTAAVLAEHAPSLFALGRSTPCGYAAVPLAHPGAPIRRKKKGPRGAPQGPARPSLSSVLRADGTVALRVVDKKSEPLFHALLTAFAARTGCPVLLADTLGLESEPTVCTPRDAYAFFMRTDLDHLVMGPFLIDKRQQPLWEES